jgi:hypothetical protein
LTRIAPRERIRAVRKPWEQLAALGGIVAVALWILSVAILESTDSPDDANPAEVLSWYQDESNTILAAGFLFELGGVCFLVFLAVLRHRLWWVEGGTGLLSTLAFAAGVGTALFSLALPAADMAAALAEDDLSPEAAQAYSTLDTLFFIGAEFCAALLVASVAFLALRTRVLPAALAWFSLLLALLLLIPPIGWAGLIFGMPIWILIVAVLLYIKPKPIPGPPPHTAAFVGTESP